MWGKETLPVRWFGPRQARAQEKTPYHCCACPPRLRVPTHRNVVPGYNRSFDQAKRKTLCLNQEECWHPCRHRVWWERPVPPHPGSLPRGDGESYPDSRRFAALRVYSSAGDGSPSPWGEGWVRGNGLCSNPTRWNVNRGDLPQDSATPTRLRAPWKLRPCTVLVWWW